MRTKANYLMLCQAGVLFEQPCITSDNRQLLIDCAVNAEKYSVRMNIVGQNNFQH